MKKFFFTLFALLSLTTYAQEANPDSTVDVVAYFSKNDSVKYTYVHNEFRVNEKNDTVNTVHYWRDFQLVVTDSTKDGYTLEYTLLDFNKPDSSSVDFKAQLQAFIFGKLKGLKLNFKLNEFGEVQKLENWKDVAQRCKDLPQTVGSMLFEKHPEVAKLLNKKAIESLLKTAVSDEESVRGFLPEMESLFKNHGSSFSFGKRQIPCDAEKTEGFSSESTVTADTIAADEDDEFGGYFVLYEGTATMPGEGLASLITDIASSVGTEKLSDQADKASNQLDIKNMRLSEQNYFEYFWKGWPKEIEIDKDVLIQPKGQKQYRPAKLVQEKITWAEANM